MTAAGPAIMLARRMTSNGELQLVGIDQLAGVAEARILLVGFDVERTPEGRALLAVFPGAQVVSLDDRSKQPMKAGRAVGARSCDVVIAVQNYRKLKLLTFASRAKRRFVLVHGSLLPIHGSDLVLLVAHPARIVWEQAKRHLQYPRLPEPIGAGNDYGHFEERAIALPPRWPRIRASVIVPVYNRRAVLSKTLAALTLQTYPRELFEVIIADDGSRDRPDELIPLYRDRLDLRYVVQEDLGYRLAEVRNLAIEAARGEVIVSLDCDMLPEPRFLESHLRWFHAADRRMVVIGYRKFVDTEHLSPQDVLQNFDRVRTLPETLAPAAIRREDAPTRDWRIATFESTRLLRDHPAPYLFASGGNVAYRKREAIEAGLYSPKYQKWGGEDVDFGYRLERLGCWFVAEPGALAYHQDHPSAVVREEDKQVTGQILARRVPRLRAKAGPSAAEFELPMTTVVILDDGEGDLPSALESVLEQSSQDLEVVIVSNHEDRSIPMGPARVRTVFVPGEARGGRLAAEGLAHAQCEFLLVMKSSESLMKSAIQALSTSLRQDSRVAFAFGGARAEATSFVPRRYSRLSHLLGEYFVCPALLRVRDVHRAGGFEASLASLYEMDLTLRMGERGLGRVEEIPLLRRAELRSPNVTEFEQVANLAMSRLGLRWEASGWPPTVRSNDSRIETIMLDLRRQLFSSDGR